MFDQTLELSDMLLRAGTATVMGLCVGWDRERNNKAAGLRTMALVSLGAAGMMLGTVEITAAMASTDFPVDPTRVSAGVIGGIGFLGAGSIIQSRGTVQGMTTAASIWAVSGIGIACGLGQFELAGVLFGLMMVVLVVVSFFKGTVLPQHDTAPEPGDEGPDGKGGTGTGAVPDATPPNAGR